MLLPVGCLALAAIDKMAVLRPGSALFSHGVECTLPHMLDCSIAAWSLLKTEIWCCAQMVLHPLKACLISWRKCCDGESLLLLQLFLHQILRGGFWSHPPSGRHCVKQ